jgi:hypothetical protein
MLARELLLLEQIIKPLLRRSIPPDFPTGLLPDDRTRQTLVQLELARPESGVAQLPILLGHPICVRRGCRRRREEGHAAAETREARVEREGGRAGRDVASRQNVRIPRRLDQPGLEQLLRVECLLFSLLLVPFRPAPRVRQLVDILRETIVRFEEVLQPPGDALELLLRTLQQSVRRIQCRGDHVRRGLHEQRGRTETGLLVPLTRERRLGALPVDIRRCDRQGIRTSCRFAACSRARLRTGDRSIVGDSRFQVVRAGWIREGFGQLRRRSVGVDVEQGLCSSRGGVRLERDHRLAEGDADHHAAEERADRPPDRSGTTAAGVA